MLYEVSCAEMTLRWSGAAAVEASTAATAASAIKQFTIASCSKAARARSIQLDGLPLNAFNLNQSINQSNQLPINPASLPSIPLLLRLLLLLFLLLLLLLFIVILVWLLFFFGSSAAYLVAFIFIWLCPGLVWIDWEPLVRFGTVRFGSALTHRLPGQWSFCLWLSYLIYLTLFMCLCRAGDFKAHLNWNQIGHCFTDKHTHTNTQKYTDTHT